MSFRETQTFKNLANAFAGESQARNRYSFFAGVAAKDGYKHIEAVFRETADNEKEHAKMFYKLLVRHGGEEVIHVDADYPLIYKDTLSHLKAAAAGEHEEWAVIYTQFGDAAEKEGFMDVAQAFRRIAEVEKHHEERFLALAGDVAGGHVFKRESATTWKCMNCGYVHEGTEAPEVCPACEHPQGFFKALPQAY